MCHYSACCLRRELLLVVRDKGFLQLSTCDGEGDQLLDPDISNTGHLAPSSASGEEQPPPLLPITP